MPWPHRTISCGRHFRSPSRFEDSCRDCGDCIGFSMTRAPSSRQERSRRGTQSYVAFDLDALFLDRRRQTQLAPEFTGRLFDRKLRRSRDGADVTVRTPEIEELAI